MWPVQVGRSEMGSFGRLGRASDVKGTPRIASDSVVIIDIDNFDNR